MYPVEELYLDDLLHNKHLDLRTIPPPIKAPKKNSEFLSPAGLEAKVG